MKTQKRKKANRKKMGMRQRWLLRTSLAAGIAGLLCVLLGTAIFAGCIYAARVEEIGEYVDTAKAFFDDRVNKSEAEYYDACVIYTLPLLVRQMLSQLS